MSREDYERIPLDELCKPKDGYVVWLSKWWRVDKDGNALIYIKDGHYAPQFNSNEDLARRMVEMFKGDHVEYIPIAYIKNKH